MTNYPECVVCGVTIYASELYLCAEHQAWHRGWVHVPRVSAFTVEVFGNNRHNRAASDFDAYRSFAHWEYMHGDPEAIQYAPHYPLWVTVHDIDRRAKWLLEQPDEGAA